MWDAAGIPFHPNSRFGVGVFSYFMLANELVAESAGDNGQVRVWWIQVLLSEFSAKYQQQYELGISSRSYLRPETGRGCLLADGIRMSGNWEVPELTTLMVNLTKWV